MRINPISNVNSSRITRVKRQNEQPAQTPNFKGEKGRAIGSVLGVLAAGVGVTLLTASGIGIPFAPIVAAGIGAKLGGDAGNDIENKNQKNGKNKTRT